MTKVATTPISAEVPGTLKLNAAAMRSGIMAASDTIRRNLRPFRSIKKYAIGEKLVRLAINLSLSQRYSLTPT